MNDELRKKIDNEIKYLEGVIKHCMSTGAMDIAKNFQTRLFAFQDILQWCDNPTEE
jgi:hypothetical protein